MDQMTWSTPGSDGNTFLLGEVKVMTGSDSFMGNYNTMGTAEIEILTYLYKPSLTEIKTTRFYVLYLFHWVDLCHTKLFLMYSIQSSA